MPGSVVVAGARTPIGKLSGALAGFTAMDLGGLAIAAALERAGLSPEDVDYVFMGQVLQAGQGQITARQAATKADIPMSVPATTVNKVCLSGLNTIYLADLLIQAGEADVVAGAGDEADEAAVVVRAEEDGLNRSRRINRAQYLFETRICGRETSRRVRKRSSPRTARRTSATRPTTQAGRTATGL